MQNKKMRVVGWWCGGSSPWYNMMMGMVKSENSGSPSFLASGDDYPRAVPPLHLIPTPLMMTVPQSRLHIVQGVGFSSVLGPTIDGSYKMMKLHQCRNHIHMFHKVFVVDKGIQGFVVDKEPKASNIFITPWFGLRDFLHDRQVSYGNFRVQKFNFHDVYSWVLEDDAQDPLM
ncbi:unnamed protein product [Sphenostylis stenocarpa]|uniref:Uncharacterized protein n=1 Tax=Sphenostylis stenocarpa TaxID=92480 RepID=A0AA86TDK3_9FABA|nr:unnamed protein product [Sphenostylis stenocarpa]